MFLPHAIVGLVLVIACSSDNDTATDTPRYNGTITYSKCCESGLGLQRASEHVGFQCVRPSNSSAIEVSSLVTSTQSDYITTGFPKTCSARDLRAVNPSELDDLDELPIAHCIDNVVAGNVTASVVALVCDSQQNEKLIKVPNIVAVNKCCPLGLNYDEVDHICAYSNVTANVVEHMFRDDDVFLNYSFGAPTCDEVLVDRFIRPSDVVRHDASLVVQGLTPPLGAVDGFCVEQVRDDKYSLVIRSCDTVRNSCRARNCFRKCCPEGESYDGQVCTPSGAGVAAFPFQRSGRELQDLGILHGLKCSRYSLDPTVDPADEFHIEPGGSLYVPLFHDDPHIALDRYCVETRGQDVIALLCFTDKDPSEINGIKLSSHISYLLVLLGLIPSCVLLFTTLIVYLLLPSLQNLHGKTLMCHMASMFSAYLWLITSIFFKSYQMDVFCKVVGYLMLFSFLASFFWLNIMCIDIWWTFRSLRSVHHGMKRHGEIIRFSLYSLYAWGLPSTMTVICVVMDLVPGLSPFSIKPDMGITNCWFSRYSYGIVVYFYGPVAFLILSNIVLFLLTAYNCSKVKAEIHKMRSDSRKNTYRADKMKFVMNVKLFVVMGVSWALEFVSHMVNLPDEVWYISDAVNSLQGVLIFCIFVLKRKVLRELKRRFRAFCGRRDAHANKSAMPCYDPYTARKSASTSTLCTTVLSHSSEVDKKQRGNCNQP